jgi:hypothetical protein
MNLSCFFSNLTSTEWASWVQAIGSIVAILSATGIAIWQSKKQHESALNLHKIERKYSKIETAKTLLALSRNCAIASGYFTGQLDERDKIHKVATREVHFDFEELQALQNGVSSIPIHQLPHPLVNPAMILGANLRQLRQNIEIMLKEYTKVDAIYFGEFFQKMQEITSEIEETQNDIKILVNQIENTDDY